MDAQVEAVSTTKLSGQVSNNQIESVNVNKLSGQIGQSNISADVFKVKIFKELAGNRTLLGESDTTLLYSNKGTSSYLTLVPGESLIYEYPVENMFDCVVSAVNLGSITGIYFSENGSEWSSSIFTVTSLDVLYNRLEFAASKKRFIKFTFNVLASNLRLYLLRPSTVVYADKVMAGVIKAKYIETDQFSWKFLKKDIQQDFLTISLGPDEEKSFFVQHAPLDLFCGEPYLDVFGVGSYEFLLREVIYQFPNGQTNQSVGIWITLIGDGYFTVRAKNYHKTLLFIRSVYWKRSGIAQI
jgi:hypothetical protein